ncbi:hypothetical protein O181_066187 [Austropuccinia psidii MF-1]|uniref:Vacuolar protein-sorting-associated protein 36 n=1 Tax=Austropuccinia psidii MF-1 TaxID=1389203 RepID=A0A9Q3EYP9_9BASI|nr:hypothetical protein [Austropuccinia psidii MF-1]
MVNSHIPALGRPSSVVSSRVMHRLRPIDCTTLSIRAQLFLDEEILHYQAGVGLYDGKDKDERYQDGTLYLTSHRLIYVDSSQPHRHSCFLDICLIRQTEYWIGFFKSSPKITLLLGDRPAQAFCSNNLQDEAQASLPLLDPTDILNHPATSHWACTVCAFSNPPGIKCQLCGVPRDSSSPARSRAVSLRTFHEGSNSTSLARTTSINGIRSANSSSPSTDIAQTSADPTAKEIPCPTCTFLNHPSMIRCEMCDSTLGVVQISQPTLSQLSGDNLSTSEDPATVTLQHSRATTPAPPASFPSNSYIRLSFRKGGDKSFYFTLKNTLQTKSWQSASTTPNRNCSHSSSLSAAQALQSASEPAKLIGIDGILKTMDIKNQSHQAELEDGLRDLQALMAKAKEMVQMAQSINVKLTALETSPILNEAEPSQQKVAAIRSSLVKLGLPAPAVTPDMIASDQAYAQELARELGGLLTQTRGAQEALMKDGSDGAMGIRSLDEVWCMWNRARGVSLVSPADMLTACQYLAEYTNPQIRLRTFSSGLRVLHTPYFGITAFADRLLKRFQSDKKDEDACMWQEMTTLEVAHAEGLSTSLASEMLEMLEQSEETPIVRDFDIQTGIVKWFPNLISSYQWAE